MIKKILKWTGTVIGGLVILLLAFYAYIYFNIESRINKTYKVKVQNLIIPADSLSRAKGKHLAEIRACTGCHGTDFSGGMAFADEESPVGIIYSTNITKGKGGINYTDADWIRVLRHGLGKDNRSLWFMPSHEIYQISNQDLASIISYVKTCPPVDKENRNRSIKPLGRILTFFDQFPLLPAEKIDHNAVPIDAFAVSITPEYGKYLAITCTGCHTENFKGAKAHGPGEPPIPDISSTGNLGKWSPQDFVTTLQTGKTPNGKQLNPAMPWKTFNYTHEELNAIYTYLHGLP